MNTDFDLRFFIEGEDFIPSVNEIWQPRWGSRRVVLSQKAKKAKELIYYHALRAMRSDLGRFSPFDGPVGITAIFFFTNGRKDTDNRLKILLDGLEGAIYKRDAQVRSLYVINEKVENGAQTGVFVGVSLVDEGAAPLSLDALMA
jgi:Holliday junction resolvase RusA-like endonuclease